MAHVQVENVTLAASNDKFSAIWWLTRAMKTAGWRYKASSNGTNTKDSTGNPSLDTWGGGGTVQAATTAAMTISSPTTTAYGGRSTISGMTGGTFTASSVGHFLTITSATNGGNNGTFLITNYISATSVTIENPSAVAETTPGTATFAETSALLDVYPPVGLASGGWWCAQGPSTLKVPIGTSTPSGNFLKGENVTQATTGATGEVIGVLIDQTNGGYLVIAPRLSGTGAGVRGWDGAHAITGAISGVSASPSGTVIEYVREIVFWHNDMTTGHWYYQCVDNVNEVTPTSTATTIAVGSNGLPLPQATIAVTSTAGFPGFPLGGTLLVISTFGTQTVTYTGISGNTFTGCSGGSGNLSTGNSVVLANSKGRFSTMAATVIGGADYIHCPGSIAGNDPTTNGFPAMGTLVVYGRAGAGTAATGAIDWTSNTNSCGTGTLQALCCNAIEDANVSADGTFTLCVGIQPLSTTIASGSNGIALPTGTINVASNTFANTSGVLQITTSNGPQTVSYTGKSGSTQFTGCTGGTGTMSTGGLVTYGYFTLIGFLRLDDQEDGDVDPYVAGVANSPVGVYNRNRLGTGLGNGATGAADSMNSFVWSQSSSFVGFRRRGLPPLGSNVLLDSFQEYQGGAVGQLNGLAIAQNSQDLVACVPGNVYVREPIWIIFNTIVYASGAYANNRKGTVRWWYWVSNGAATDTYDNKRWLQGSSAWPAIIVGPLDGTTTPSNQ